LRGLTSKGRGRERKGETRKEGTEGGKSRMKGEKMGKGKSGMLPSPKQNF